VNRAIAVYLIFWSAIGSRPLSAQTGASGAAITGLPISTAVSRALAAGTRDSSGRPPEKYWQIHPAYSIRARLDPSSALVSGTETIHIRNASPGALDRIQIRLDQNRFRRGTPGLAEANATDGMTITRLAVDGQTAPIGSRGSTLPQLSGTHRTSETLRLATPLTPGAAVTLEIDWHFAVPLDDSSTAIRQGRWGRDVFQIAQWYPRIAMFDDLNGWDTTSYSGEVEFFNPFARFDVRIDVPAGWIVGATGSLQNERQVLSPRTLQRLRRARASDSTVTIVAFGERGATAGGDGRLTWAFVADSVSDFAWGASQRYTWRSSRIRTGGTVPVQLHLLYTARNARAFDTADVAMRRELSTNSSIILPYAFPQHTLLDGPEGGMEYPMLTMSNGDLRRGHELWHQWFPMTVGTNETWYSFMDEGFATYLAGLSRHDPSQRSIRRSLLVPLIWPDDREPPSSLAAINGYSRPTEMFLALEALVGRAAVLHALSVYATEWRFKHPTPWDFMFTMNRVLGRNLDKFWYKWIFTPD
jgi:hypothetical protein